MRAPDRMMAVWEPRADEVDKARDAFIVYRGMHERSIAKTAAQVGAPLSTVKSWSRRYLWRERAVAFDRHVDRSRRREIELDTTRAARRHLKLSRRLQSVAAQYIEKLETLVRMTNDDDLAGARFVKVFAQAVSELAKLDRLVQGEPTERIQETGPDLANLSDAEFETLEALYVKARVGTSAS